MEQYGKRIRVFKNGDGYFTGKKMLISPIYCRIYEQVSGNDYMHLSECVYLWVDRMYLCYVIRMRIYAIDAYQCYDMLLYVYIIYMLFMRVCIYYECIV